MQFGTNFVEPSVSTEDVLPLNIGHTVVNVYYLSVHTATYRLVYFKLFKLLR